MLTDVINFCQVRKGEKPCVYAKRITKFFLVKVVLEEGFNRIDLLDQSTLDEIKLYPAKRQALHEKFKSGEAEKIIDEKWPEFLERYVADANRNKLTKPTKDTIDLYDEDSKKDRKRKFYPSKRARQEFQINNNYLERQVQKHMITNKFGGFLASPKKPKPNYYEHPTLNKNLNRSADDDMLSELRLTLK